MSYLLVKYFDGRNDGLVGEKSFPWGSDFKMLEPHGKRGISHGDMIDLNRENIKDFDVREFYVNLVNDLRVKGF
jgi:triacylglycerol lipase